MGLGTDIVEGIYSDTVLNLYARRSQTGDQTADDGSGLVERHCLRWVLGIDVDMKGKCQYAAARPGSEMRILGHSDRRFLPRQRCTREGLVTIGGLVDQTQVSCLLEGERDQTLNSNGRAG